jgi:hypothetical protein
LGRAPIRMTRTIQAWPRSWTISPMRYRADIERIDIEHMDIE